MMVLIVRLLARWCSAWYSHQHSGLPRILLYMQQVDEARRVEMRGPQSCKSRPNTEAGEVLREVAASPSQPAGGSGGAGSRGGVPEAKLFCSILTAMDDLWRYLNLVATRVIWVGLPISCFIIVWAVSDNGNELQYCSQTQKYCMTNIPFNTVILLVNGYCIIVFLYILYNMLHIRLWVFVWLCLYISL